MTATESTAGDGTATRAASVTPLGPEVYDDANNWALTNAAPVDSDDVYFQNNPDRHAKYNLNQTGIGLESLNIAQDMEAEIGLPRWNANGYFEYRPTYIQGGDAGVTTDINVGKGPGRGSGRIKINTEAGPTILNVFNTGTPIEEGIPALLWKGTEATNVVNVRRGSVGIAIFPGEAATVATLRVGYVDNQESDANVRCGSGVTMGVVTQTGGQTELNAGTSGAVTVTGGRLTVNAGNIAELVVQNATVEYAGVGTLGGTSVKLRENGILDLTNGQGTMTLSNFNMFKGSTLRAPKGRFASAPVIRLNGCTIDDVTVEIEDDFDVDHV
jgi:hypothetical protein